jgi:ferredoxin
MAYTINDECINCAACADTCPVELTQQLVRTVVLVLTAVLLPQSKLPKHLCNTL